MEAFSCEEVFTEVSEDESDVEIEWRSLRWRKKRPRQKLERTEEAFKVRQRKG